jgi:multiple sugar transport system substrate-binding protein
VALLPADVPYDDISNLLAGAPTSTYGTFGAGLAGIIWDGFWAFLALDKYWPNMDYGMTKYPTPNGTKEEWKLYTGWVWDPTIPKGSKHPDEAWSFLKYGYWEHGEMLADTLNWTSAIKKFPEFEKRTIAVMGENNRERPFLHHFSEAQYGAAYFIPWTPIHQKLWDGVGQAVDATVRGQKKAQEALDELASTLQPDLDKAAAEGF